MKTKLLFKLKNYFLASLTLLLANCSRSQDVDTIESSISENYGKAGNVQQSTFSVSLNADPLNKCSGGFTPINLDTQYIYFDEYNVFCYDGYSGDCSLIGNGKPCIDLSHFVGTKADYIGGNPINFKRILKFYGSNGENLFNSYNPSGYGTINEASFTIGAESNSYFFVGGIAGSMPNDAANTVLHSFKNQIKNLPSYYSGSVELRPTILAAHFRVEAYLCDLPYREVKMRIKYIY